MITEKKNVSNLISNSSSSLRKPECPRVPKHSFRFGSPISILLPERMIAEIKNFEVLVIKFVEKNLSYNFLHSRGWVDVKVKNKKEILIFSRSPYSLQNWVVANTLRSIFLSMANGLQKPFEKIIRIVGVGYYFSITLPDPAQYSNVGGVLKFFFRAAVPKKFLIPKGVEFELLDRERLRLSSSSKILLGEVAKNIRLLMKPGKYLGEGIRYDDEIVKLKKAKKTSGT